MTGASETIQQFLNAMQARDLAKAQSFLSDDFVMQFPGGGEFRTLAELIDWSKPRYQSVGKEYERFDESDCPEGVVVYCYGTLHGVWLDGSEFSGIRFIDRFTVKDGKLIDQKVWNDLAEYQSQQA